MSRTPTAEDVERPKCECHGEPMTRHSRRADRVTWRCSVANRERFRKRCEDPEFAQRNRERVAAHYRTHGRRQRQELEADRKRRGLCVRCTQPLLTEALCWDCLNRMEERRT